MATGEIGLLLDHVQTLDQEQGQGRVITQLLVLEEKCVKDQTRS